MSGSDSGKLSMSSYNPDVGKFYLVIGSGKKKLLYSRHSCWYCGMKQILMLQLPLLFFTLSEHYSKLVHWKPEKHTSKVFTSGIIRLSWRRKSFFTGWVRWINANFTPLHK